GFAELDADVFATPWWSLYGGIETTVGVKFSVLGTSIADYESPNLIGFRLLLAQATTPAPTPTPSPTATPTPIPSPTPTPPLGQFSQQGLKLVGTGTVGHAQQGYSVSLCADGNTAIVGGPERH